MARPLYGPGTAPTTKQIMEAIVEHNGLCHKFLSSCLAHNDGVGRGGANCPLYPCSTRAESLHAARVYLMTHIL